MGKGWGKGHEPLMTDQHAYSKIYVTGVPQNMLTEIDYITWCLNVLIGLKASNVTTKRCMMVERLLVSLTT